MATASSAVVRAISTGAVNPPTNEVNAAKAVGVQVVGGLVEQQHVGDSPEWTPAWPRLPARPTANQWTVEGHVET
ncbi:MAG: hypothetical protein R2742_04945 [Micropruina glycogenica]